MFASSVLNPLPQCNESHTTRLKWRLPVHTAISGSKKKQFFLHVRLLKRKMTFIFPVFVASTVPPLCFAWNLPTSSSTGAKFKYQQGEKKQDYYVMPMKSCKTAHTNRSIYNIQYLPGRHIFWLQDIFFSGVVEVASHHWNQGSSCCWENQTINDLLDRKKGMQALQKDNSNHRQLVSQETLGWESYRWPCWE